MDHTKKSYLTPIDIKKLVQQQMEQVPPQIPIQMLLTKRIKLVENVSQLHKLYSQIQVIKEENSKLFTKCLDLEKMFSGSLSIDIQLKDEKSKNLKYEEELILLKHKLSEIITKTNKIDINPQSKPMVLEEKKDVLFGNPTSKPQITIQETNTKILTQQEINKPQSPKQGQKRQVPPEFEENPSKKLKLSQLNVDTDIQEYSINCQNIRKCIPERLNSGYVIHAFLSCALNGMGVDIIYDSDGGIKHLNVWSFWSLRIYCIFIIKNVLRKKTSIGYASNWDKTLKQRWFVNWTQKESFLAQPKEDRKLAIVELMKGHCKFSEQERWALLDEIQFSNPDDIDL